MVSGIPVFEIEIEIEIEIGIESACGNTEMIVCPCEDGSDRMHLKK